MTVTGTRPPSEPPTARDYAAHGLPWFDYYGGDRRAVARQIDVRTLMQKIASQFRVSEKVTTGAARRAAEVKDECVIVGLGPLNGGDQALQSLTTSDVLRIDMGKVAGVDHSHERGFLSLRCCAGVRASLSRSRR